MKLVLLGTSILGAARDRGRAQPSLPPIAHSGTDPVVAAPATHDHNSTRSVPRRRASPARLPRTRRRSPRPTCPYPAELPPVPTGDLVKVHMVLKDVTIEIAPGVKYAAWGFEGGAPGPVIHVRQGQTVEMTLTNNGAIPHSIDFHAARIAPDKAFIDVPSGGSFTVPIHGE